MMSTYCYHCMSLKENEGACPVCGHTNGRDDNPHHLPMGTILAGRYLLGRVLGEGGFGITYLGRDLRLNMVVAVKEYYPVGYVTRNCGYSEQVYVVGRENAALFDGGKEKFIREAQILGMLAGDKSIVEVRNYFIDNNTAYIVMEYVDGVTLSDALVSNGRFGARELIERMMPLLEALKRVHELGLIHRDISPDNIMLLPDGSLKLMDFGAARQVNYADKRSLSIVFKPGYAPEEQYRSKGEQGPWTDVYSLCATIYKCITGSTPDESTERVYRDKLIPPSKLGVDISPAQEHALLKGMAVYGKDRYDSADALMRALSAEAYEETPPAGKKKRLSKRVRRLIIAAGAVLACAVIGVSVTMIYRSIYTNELNRLKTEGSITSYIEAIRMDPADADSYILLLDQLEREIDVITTDESDADNTASKHRSREMSLAELERAFGSDTMDKLRARNIEWYAKDNYRLGVILLEKLSVSGETKSYGALGYAMPYFGRVIESVRDSGGRSELGLKKTHFRVSTYYYLLGYFSRNQKTFNEIRSNSTGRFEAGDLVRYLYAEGHCGFLGLADGAYLDDFYGAYWSLIAKSTDDIVNEDGLSLSPKLHLDMVDFYASTLTQNKNSFFKTENADGKTVMRGADEVNAFYANLKTAYTTAKTEIGAHSSQSGGQNSGIDAQVDSVGEEIDTLADEISALYQKYENDAYKKLKLEKL